MGHVGEAQSCVGLFEHEQAVGERMDGGIQALVSVEGIFLKPECSQIVSNRGAALSHQSGGTQVC